MILGLSGYAGSGKDAIADRLVTRWGWRRAAFADPIRRILERVDPIVMTDFEGDYERISDRLELGWDQMKRDPEVRRLMQAIGDACREVFGEYVFINAARNTIYEALPPATNWVIPDVRMANEVMTMSEDDFQLVRVTRPGYGPVNDHSSETELDGYDFDGEFMNAGTLEDLHRWVDQRVESGVWG